MELSVASRRQIQRKFPPSTIVTWWDDWKRQQTFALVIGWHQTAPKFKRDGTLSQAMSWSAMVLEDGMLRDYSFGSFEGAYTLEEWEKDVLC